MDVNEEMKTEFKKYAKKDHDIDPNAIESYARINQPNAMTPHIIEERKMNVAQMDVFSRLMMERIIFLGLPIDDDVSNVVQAQLLFLQNTDSSKDVQIYINSPGGKVYSGLGIYDTMRHIEPNVATTCTGLAASMGAILLCGGAKGMRSALPHSRIMIHQPLGGAEGQASDIEITAQQIVKLKEELYQILANHSGQKYDKIYNDSDRDFWMTSEEAKEYGVIDEIVDYSDVNN